jgi:helicase required for RNAi-mediated heterochromatin assembly 1
MTRSGPVCRVEFSTSRAEKRISWERSKRLRVGTILALTTLEDGFSKGCKIAIVAQRPYEGGLDQFPPQVDITWADPSEAVLDPEREMYMIEARTGFYEGARHTLIGLQLAASERYECCLLLTLNLKHED